MQSSLYQPKYTPIDRSAWDSLKDRLPTSLFKKNSERFFKLFHSKHYTKQGDFALLRGSSEVPLYNSDVSYPEY